jgi:hypothetical protein
LAEQDKSRGLLEFQCGWCGSDICCEPPDAAAPEKQEVVVCNACGKKVRVHRVGDEIEVHCEGE